MSGMPPGAAFHLAFAQMLQMSGIEPRSVPMVPSQGAAPGFQELAAGGVHIIPSSLPEGRPLVEAGRVRAIAVLADERIPAFPDVPTAREQGVQTSGGTWRGIAGPAGLPADITARLTEAVTKVAGSQEYRSFLSERGFGHALVPGDGSAASLRSSMRRMARSWHRSGSVGANSVRLPDLLTGSALVVLGLAVLWAARASPRTTD
jgi:tripartite-type tricarboxylate transporter receptor subunit TctC